MIINEENRIGKEFGYWCDRGGGDIIDGVFVLTNGYVSEQVDTESFNPAYDNWEGVDGYVTELYDDTLTDQINYGQ